MGFYVYFKGRPTDIPSRFFFLIIVHWFKMLFSAVQQSDSVMHVFFFLIFFSIMVYHRILNVVPFVIQ